MKYMVIIYGNDELWASFPPDVLTEGIAKVDAFNKKFHDSGELVGAWGLGGEPKIVRVRDGVPAVTDGPYLEAKEFVSSFFILDCGEERALEIAAEYPFAAHAAVEVWPVPHEAKFGV